jgi:hypothetical protein
MKTLTIIFSLFLLFSCSNTKEVVKIDSEVEYIPDWYLATWDDSNYVIESSAATSTNLEIAIAKASTEARAKIARNIEMKINSMQKKLEEEIDFGNNSELISQFTQATKTVVSTELYGSKITKRKIIKDGYNWKVFVLAEYPIIHANEAFLNKIVDNNNLYLQLKNSEVFKELNNEVKQYEEIKQNN